MGGKPNVVLSFGAIEAKTAPLATSQDDNANLAVLKQVESNTCVIIEL